MTLADLYERCRILARRLARDESGASAIEYGLIAGLVAVGLIGALTLIGGNLNDTFTAIADALSGSGSGSGGGGG